MKDILQAFGAFYAMKGLSQMLTSQKQPQEASEFIRMEECGKPLSSDLFGCPR